MATSVDQACLQIYQLSGDEIDAWGTMIDLLLGALVELQAEISPSKIRPVLEGRSSRSGPRPYL